MRARKYFITTSLISSFFSLQIPCDKKFQIDQHVKTSTHVAKLGKTKSGDASQPTLSQCFQPMARNKELNEQEIFNRDLCHAMMTSNIPLSKLRNQHFTSFLQKYCRFNIPGETTLRRNDVSSLYSEVIAEIKGKICNKHFYICIDETTDSRGRYIAHLLIGVLNDEILPKSYLIASKELEKTNALTVARFVQEELSKFFLPTAVPGDKLLLILSDAAPYMIKAGHNLKIFYPNLIHVTCLAHALNRVAEEIRKHFPLVNSLISNMKKIFLKAPTRVQFYKERLPNTPLPPQPVITRWGTWLEAALFYCENFCQLKDLISELSDESSQSLTDVKQLFENKEIKQQLSFIKTNYSFLSKTITQMEESNLSLIQSVELVKQSEVAFRNVTGNIGGKIFQKFRNVTEKNSGFQFLSQVANILLGEFTESIDLDPVILSNFKNAPLTSVDVERSFSIYKFLYSDRRQKFLIENFEKHLVVYCFYN